MTKSVYIKAILLTAVSLFLFCLSSAENLEDRIRDFNDFSLRDMKQLYVEDIEIVMPWGKIELKEGQLFIGGYYEDQPTAAFFEGDGLFHYKPSESPEKHQISRFYNADSIIYDFENAYFAFPWISWVNHILKGEERGEKSSYRQRVFFEQMRNIPEDKFKINLPFHIYKAGIEGRRDFLYVDFASGRYEHTVLLFDPNSPEPVSVYKISPAFKNPQLVSSISGKTKGSRHIPRTEFEIKNYDIGIDISTYAKSSIRCDILIKAAKRNLKFAVFTLPEEYEVDSVGGNAVSYMKEKDRAELAIELDDLYHRGDTANISVWYRTNLFRHYMEYGVTQKNLTYWYPYSGYRQLSNYDIKYRIADSYSFVSVGEKVGDTIIDGTRHLHYVSPKPVAYISFNYGVFDSLKIDTSESAIVLHYLKNRHNSPIFGRENLGNIAGDIGGAFEFYNKVFAPYGFGRLDVDAMSVGYGQGSPGVVHLSELTFDRSRPGFDDKFRAHEIAHQWWGHIINPASYRDIWLSEGFAEYSAALFIQIFKGDNETFGKILKRWRKNILQKGRLGDRKSIGYRAGSIIMGRRLLSELSPGDYEVIVYYKAAYLLHMLRVELNCKENRISSSYPGDLKIRGDEPFLKLLAEYISRHGGTLVSSDDFIKVAREYLGDRAEIFFNQWLYDWRVPDIDCDWEEKNGVLYLEIEVSDIGDNFSTPYPVHIEYNKGSSEVRCVLVEKGRNKKEIAIPDGREVQSVSFNPDFDILEQ